MLQDAIKQSRGKTAKAGGIGGGTCAAFFRRIDVPAVVWSTIDETAHQPNEYTRIQNLIDDTKTYAILAAM
jgi:succinyl-diaminopimelate desuccinylase